MASFTPEIVATVGSIPITNTFINTVFVDAIIIITALYIKNNLRKVPGIFQNIMETVIENFYNFMESVTGKNTVKIFPFVMSFFLFILVSNWSGLIPGLGSVGIYEIHEGKSEFIPIMRNLTSDLNATLGLALISFVATHVLSIQTIGIKDYLGRYFSFNPINLFVGILEIVSEITKIISLSFRLFGNIFAGEVVLTTVSSLFAFIFPIPFMLLEIIVGLVQALVFSLLTMVFMSILMTTHHDTSHAAKEVT